MGFIYNGVLLGDLFVSGRKILRPYTSEESSNTYTTFSGYKQKCQVLNENMSIQIREPGYTMEPTSGFGCGSTILRVTGNSSSTGPNSITWTTYRSSSIKWANNIEPTQCHDGDAAIDWLIAFYFLNDTVYGVASLYNISSLA